MRSFFVFMRPWLAPRHVFAQGALILGLVGGVHAAEPSRADWFPDQADIPHFQWTYAPCDGCQPLAAKPEWLALARLAGLGKVRFLLAVSEANGPAYSYPPNVVVLTPSALDRPPCQQAFLVGHEMVHIAQRHFDEDAYALAVLSGRPSGWTRNGEQAMTLLDGDFGLALRMSVFWQQQEREADWVGALLAAHAEGCSLEDSALSYLRADEGFGGGVAAAHEASADRERFLRAFAESARRLAERAD